MRVQSVKGEGITFTGRNFNLLSAAGKVVGVEALIWIAALLFLALIEPAESTHYTLCPFSAVGIDFCPGCGIGRSISMLYRGDIFGSLKMHPLGIFALTMIFYRIVTLFQKNKIKTKGVNYG